MTNLRLRKTTQMGLIGFLLASAVSGCATQSPGTAPNAQSATPTVAASPASAQAQFYGAKKSIAVAKFDANGAFLNSYGGAELGGGLSAIMVSELDKTGAFRVVNRSDLDAALYEQSLSLQGLTATDTVKAGQLVGAQYLVRGSVTEFSNAKKGGGISIGGDLGGLLGAVSPQRRVGHIGIDVSVFDATTGEVVAITTVKKEVKKMAIGGSITGDGWSVGANKFENTVLGEAAREAIAEAVEQVAGALSGRAWTAQVAQVRGNILYVNAGAESGLKIGDTLTIARVTDRIVDPVTGAVLGLEDVTVGTATVSEVQGQYAKATFNASRTPVTGDTLKLNTSQRFAGNGFQVAQN